MAEYRFTLLFLLFSISLVQCSRILVVFPMPSPSHNILGSALAKGLVKAGHDVTYITAFHDKNLQENGQYTEVYLDGLYEKFQALNRISLGQAIKWDLLFKLNTFSTNITNWILENPNFHALIHSKTTFDVVIAEQSLMDATKALAPHFNASLITFSTQGANDMVNHIVGNPSPKSYIPNFFLPFPAKMNFLQRLLNILFKIFFDYITHCLMLPTQSNLAKKYFPNTPELEQIIYNTSLVFLNSDLSTNQAVPNVPSMINIGGYHIDPPNALPEDLKAFLDNAKHGAIYFSMGSNLKSKDMEEKTMQSLLNAFRKLKQKVIWKFENESLPGKPDNVKIAKWLPQQDILAHPNIKLFISHGGLLSTTETVYNGVPVLSIPVFGDQQMNAAQMVHNGYGLKLDLDDLQNEELISEKLNELLTNPKYTENVKIRSRIFHDRPIKPMDSAIFWTEYVIRHKGAPHLRVAGVDLPWYQYHLLDVCFFIFVIVSSLMYISYLVIKKIFKRITCGKKIKEKRS